MRRTAILTTLLLAALLTGGAALVPARAQDPQVVLERSTIGVYDDIVVTLPGCSADAQGVEYVAGYWGVGDRWQPDHRAPYGHDSAAGDRTSSLETSRQRFAHSGGPGTYPIGGECVTIDNTVIRYAPAQVTVRYSSYLPSDPAPGWRMQPGRNVLASRPDGTGYRLVAQPDGNLVHHSPANTPIWQTATHGPHVDAPVMQPDGNLVVYSRTGNQVLWSTGTHGHPGARLVVQDDGNLVVYSAGGKPLWWTWRGERLTPGASLAPLQNLTSVDARGVLSMQRDGNLVLYGPGGAVLWQAGTRGPGNRLVMQTDGNLVVYEGSGRALWQAGTRGSGNRFIVQTDGNLVLYGSTGRALWQSGTRF